MNTETSISLDISSDESLLIEYLDGELTQTDRRRVEDRLAEEPELRKALAKLEESWHCLDLLETFATDKDLIETTLETVILDTEQTIAQQAKTVRRRFSWKLIVRPLVLLVLFGVGVFSGGRLAPDKNFFLRVASPIIERLDMYLLMYEQDQKLLPLLAQQRVFLSPLFDGEEPRALQEYYPSSTAKILDAFTVFPNFVETRRRLDRINNMDDALFKQFCSNNDRFNRLSIEKKHRLREFHERIERSPQRYELMQTLQGYYHWRKSLQSYEKAEIDRRLSTEQRVERIAAMKKRLERNTDVTDIVPLRPDEQEQSTPEELAVILENLDGHHQELVLNLSPDQAIPYLTRLHRKP